MSIHLYPHVPMHMFIHVSIHLNAHANACMSIHKPVPHCFWPCIEDHYEAGPGQRGPKHDCAAPGGNRCLRHGCVVPGVRTCEYIRRMGAWVRACVGAWVRGCVHAYMHVRMHGCVCVGVECGGCCGAMALWCANAWMCKQVEAHARIHTAHPHAHTPMLSVSCALVPLVGRGPSNQPMPHEL